MWETRWRRSSRIRKERRQRKPESGSMQRIEVGIRVGSVMLRSVVVSTGSLSVNAGAGLWC